MRKHIDKAVQNTKVRFVGVGIINTLIDFSILNLLAHGLGLPRIAANVVSVTVAMGFSFFANRIVVFGSKSAKKHKQALKFVLVTATSVYILQDSIIYILTEAWTWPLDTVYNWFNLLEKDVFMTNISKLVVTGASLVWNYIFYKRYVFKDD